jgi:hypothetical protein
MKTKKFNKKLMLNKQTIACLDADEIKKVYGGKLAPLTNTCPFTGCGSGYCC